MGKIIEVYPRAGKTPHTAPVWQYDYGQILHINGIDLPASYKAEFSNTTRGDAIATVQTTDEITIPAQFLESGAAVYIWLVVVDESSRTTEYALIVPVAARAKPTDEEPTPEEQSEIDQTLAALNSGVSRVEGIAEAIPDTINDALEAAKESGEFDGEDGSSPEVTVAPIQGGHRITITDANGTHTVDILDGAKGDTGRGIVSAQKTGTAGLADTYTITYTDNTTSTFTVTNGQNGTPGADGVTFTPAVDSSGNLSWTNNGGEPNPQPVNIKGSQGDDGTSPTVSVADITGGHRVTVMDANGTRSFDVMDGEDYVLTAADKAEIAQQAAEEVDVPVQDVQVNGTSILSNGVANVPLASTSVYGVLMAERDEDAKSGLSTARAVTPARQEKSTFYGLAKAAGADMASSSNPVGTYTDAAKNAICNMLGTERRMRLLKVVEITEETNVIGFDTDLNGLPFQVDKIEVYVYLKIASANFKDVTIGIETTSTTPTGNKWVCKLIGVSSLTSGLVGIATIVRDDYRWKAMTNSYPSQNNDDFSSLWQSSGNSRGLFLNGASWVRKNNPLYATALSACITDIVFPVGTRFEFYAHDYQG